MLTPEQEELLVSGGDCPMHTHSDGRRVTQDTLRNLHSCEKVVIISTTYTVTATDDVVLLDSSLGSFTVTIPSGTNGRRLTFKKLVAANMVTVDPVGSATIDGAATLAMTTQWQVVRLKAYNGNWLVL